MHTVWTKGCKTKPEREQRVKEVQGYRKAFEELTRLLNEHYKKKPSNRNYSEHGWAQKQIAINEYNQVLEDMIKLMEV